jgi:hypothetical protein
MSSFESALSQLSSDQLVSVSQLRSDQLVPRLHYAHLFALPCMSIFLHLIMVIMLNCCTAVVHYSASGITIVTSCGLVEAFAPGIDSTHIYTRAIE